METYVLLCCSIAVQMCSTLDGVCMCICRYCKVCSVFRIGNYQRGQCFFVTSLFGMWLRWEGVICSLEVSVPTYCFAITGFNSHLCLQSVLIFPPSL